MKKRTRFILIILLVSLLAITGFLTQCVHYTIEDYQEYAFRNIHSFLNEDYLTDEEIDRFTLYDIEEDSIGYRFRWYQMSDTDDSIKISMKIEKRWPYFGGGGMNSSITDDMLGLYSQKTKKRKWVRSLSNLFDTTVVNKANVVDYIRLLPSDTIEWTVSKQKVAEYIAKGYYNILHNKNKSCQIEFFNYVGVTRVREYRLPAVRVDFLEDNIIGLTPFLRDQAWYSSSDQWLNEDRVYEIKVE